MNYQRQYDLLINKAKARGNVDGYKERHHILPKALGGSNELSNLVELTAREHFIAHLLLAKIYGKSMWAAIHMMTRFSDTQGRAYKITARTYHTIRQGVSSLCKSNISSWRENNPEAYAATEKNRMEKCTSDARRQNAKKKALKQFAAGAASVPNFKGTCVGSLISDPKITIQLNGDKEIKAAGFNSKCINACLIGKNKTHKGYTWIRISNGKETASEETRKKQSINTKAFFSNPENLAKMQQRLLQSSGKTIQVTFDNGETETVFGLKVAQKKFGCRHIGEMANGQYSYKTNCKSIHYIGRKIVAAKYL